MPGTSWFWVLASVDLLCCDVQVIRVGVNHQVYGRDTFIPQNIKIKPKIGQLSQFLNSKFLTLIQVQVPLFPEPQWLFITSVMCNEAHHSVTVPEHAKPGLWAGSRPTEAQCACVRQYLHLGLFSTGVHLTWTHFSWSTVILSSFGIRCDFSFCCLVLNNI